MTDRQNLELDFSEPIPAEKGSGSESVPASMRVYIELACSYLRGGGAPTITVDCASIDEFECEIARLKSECDSILEEARARFGGGAGAISQPGESDSGSEHDEAIEQGLSDLRRDLRVGECMTRDVKTVERNEKLSIADELMKVGRFRHVIVTGEDDEISGVISHRDIVLNPLAWTMGQGGLAHQRSLESVTAKELMRSDIKTIERGASLSEAASLMRDNQIGCLPVTENGRLVGIITEGDLLSLLADQLLPQTLIEDAAGP
jgi:CBS domain-containing protein